MSKMILSLILIAAIAVSWGSGWSPQPSGSGSVPDPLTLDSLNVRSVAVDGNANTIHFSTPIPADTLKDLVSAGFTDSIFCTGSYPVAFGIINPSTLTGENMWVNKLEVFMRVSADSALGYWSVMASGNYMDSLFNSEWAWGVTNSDTISITNSGWGRQIWTFEKPIFLSSDLSYLFTYNDASGLGTSLMSSVVHDTLFPLIYGIDSSKVSTFDPAVMLYTNNTTYEDSILAAYTSQGLYPENGITTTFLNSRLGAIRNLLVETLSGIRPGQSVVITAPLDFNSPLSVQGTSTLSDPCWFSSGDMLVVVNGFITEFVPTP